MKLHEALSTGLPFSYKSILWRTVASTVPYTLSFIELASDDWQVRLPDGYITASYLYAVSEIKRQANKASTQPTPGMPITTPDAYTTSHTPSIVGGKDSCYVDLSGWKPPHIVNLGPIFDLVGKRCECGSEAIGGLKHSSWCPKHG